MDDIPDAKIADEYVRKSRRIIELLLEGNKIEAMRMIEEMATQYPQAGWAQLHDDLSLTTYDTQGLPF